MIWIWIVKIQHGCRVDAKEAFGLEKDKDEIGYPISSCCLV